MNSIEPVKQPELAKHDATLLDLAFVKLNYLYRLF